MKVLFVNGSPKLSKNTSGIVINAISELIGSKSEFAECKATTSTSQDFVSLLDGCNAVVFSFPLYVDGIPSHLLSLLDDISNIPSNIKLYTAVNNGYYDAHQNQLAIQMMKSFCKRSGFIWGQGVGIGAGGMINSAPIGKGPLKNLGKTLSIFSDNICSLRSDEDLFVEPNFPRFLYLKAAHIGWRSLAKKNGLKSNDLFKRLDI